MQKPWRSRVERSRRSETGVIAAGRRNRSRDTSSVSCWSSTSRNGCWNWPRRTSDSAAILSREQAPVAPATDLRKAGRHSGMRRHRHDLVQRVNDVPHEMHETADDVAPAASGIVVTRRRHHRRGKSYQKDKEQKGSTHEYASVRRGAHPRPESLPPPRKPG